MSDTPQTELDKALMFVEENPDEIHVFYNTFLNSILYLPTHDAPESDTVGVAPAGKKLSPIFTQSGGTIFLMIFDSLDRLSAWAEKEDWICWFRRACFIRHDGPQISLVSELWD